MPRYLVERSFTSGLGLAADNAVIVANAQAGVTWLHSFVTPDRHRSYCICDETSQRDALATFESLGVRPMVECLRHRLRAAGVRGLPRGPRSTTLLHPAGLTGKELAVLALLATGLRNKEIALRLSRSARTIDHHLEAIFAKLDVATRAEAVSAAYRLGIVDTNASARAD